MGFNVVVLSGRLTADPEIRMGTNDTKIARYTLAVDREKRKNTERKADFIPCVALGKNAEFVEKFLKKGMKINIRGKCRLEVIRTKMVKKYTQMTVLWNHMILQKTKVRQRIHRNQIHDQYRRRNLVSWMCQI